MTGFVPARLSIFKLAFSHKSNQATKDYAQTNNERLEYLGDAVLGTIVAEYLFKKYPNGDEGFLTKMRSKIVKRKSLNHIGDQMGLDVLLAEYNRTRLSSSMLGNAVEALVGAVYLEKGYRGTKRFVIQRMLKLYVDMHELETVDDNYKSQLLEYCQKNGTQVSYKLLNKFKQDRRDRFKVAVIVNGEQLSLADDFNKKSAEQLASLRALQKLGLIDKAVAAPTGRKSPSKDTFSSKKQTKKATSDRKPKRAPVRPKTKKAPVSDEQLAVATISKQQSSKSNEKSTKKLVSAKVKPTTTKAKTSAPTAKRRASGAKIPPKKLRRNNSRLGRSIWNGIQTAGASISVVDGMGYFEKLDFPAKQTAPAKQRKAKVPAPKEADRKTTQARRKSNSATSKQLTSTTKKAVNTEKTRQEAKPARTRKRRPVPLRLLTPIVKDTSAVMAIDFDELFADTKPQHSSPEPQARKVGRKSRRKPTSKTPNSASRQNKPAQESKENNWEETPLGLSTETVTKKQPNFSKAKARVKKEVKVDTEELDTWEDTLLEINDTKGEPKSNMTDMHKKSAAKASPSRRKSQRRKSNLKKKTEE